jgi:carbon catabolite-derepressing protein kinase
VSSFGKIPVFRSRQTTPDEVELNAFDILTFASGCDLTGLIRPLPDRVRFLVPGVDARSVLLDNILELGKEDGFSVRRNDEGGHGGVLLEAIDGRFVAQVKVHRLHEEIMMVEAERANADVVPSFWKELQSIVNVPNQRLMNT